MLRKMSSTVSKTSVSELKKLVRMRESEKKNEEKQLKNANRNASNERRKSVKRLKNASEKLSEPLRTQKKSGLSKKRMTEKSRNGSNGMLNANKKRLLKTLQTKRTIPSAKPLRKPFSESQHN